MSLALGCSVPLRDYPFPEDTTSCIAACPNFVGQNMSLYLSVPGNSYQVYTPAAVNCLSKNT